MSFLVVQGLVLLPLHISLDPSSLLWQVLHHSVHPKLGLPCHGFFVEKVTLGLNSSAINTTKDKRPVTFNGQHKFQPEVGYVAARQKAIELAMVVDEDCYGLGIERSPTGVASWSDDRRPPLYGAGSDHPTDCGTVLMYEFRHFYEDDGEQLPTSLRTKPELLVQCT